MLEPSTAYDFYDFKQSFIQLQIWYTGEYLNKQSMIIASPLNKQRMIIVSPLNKQRMIKIKELLKIIDIYIYSSKLAMYSCMMTCHEC